MTLSEPNELPKRPKKTQLWGTLEETFFIMDNKHGQQFLVEKTGDRLYELTICAYSESAPADPNQKRVEYVLHTNEAMLRILVKQIKEAINF